MKEDRYWNRAETVGELIDILKQIPPLTALRVANGHCHNDDCGDTNHWDAQIEFHGKSHAYSEDELLIYNDED